jgi:5-methylthioribose kinase
MSARPGPARYCGTLRLDDDALGDWLRRAGLASARDEIRVEPAGDGNINYVRRVRIGPARSLVVKHARERLERFPEYGAPSERLVFEHRYGEVVRERAPDVAWVLPAVVHFDAPARILVMEDLGDAPKLADALLAGRAPVAALAALGRFLGRVHARTAGDAAALAKSFENDGMRALHGEHIFSLPFAPNEFPIAPRVRAHAAQALERAGVRERIAGLRARYYERRTALVHGDVQGGNVLLQGDRPRLLDAEIAHVGDPAFDVGSALAHVRFHAALRPDDASAARAGAALLDGYRETGVPALLADATAYAGVEMLRRTLGAARMDFVDTEEKAQRVVDEAVRMLGA